MATHERSNVGTPTIPDPHTALVRALWRKGWTLARLSEALAERARRVPESATADASHLSRIVNRKKRPGPSLAAAIWALLSHEGAPPAEAWAGIASDDLPDVTPEPTVKVPPLPSESARPGRAKRVRG